MAQKLRSTLEQSLLALVFATSAAWSCRICQAAESDFDNFIVTGKAVCLNQESRETSCSDCKDRCGYGIKTTEGTIYPLDGRDSVRALFTEEHVKGQELRLTLRKKQTGELFELVKSQLVRAGHIYDFYYFCDICNITTHAPGPCMCCGKPVEYREKLAQ